MIRSETSFRLYRFLLRSLAMHCGVEKMNSAVCHISFLFVEGVLPVKSCMSAQSSGRFFLKDSRCCSISGRVGARIKIFLSGNFLNLSIVSIIAIRVLPVPVGRTTRQSFSLQVSKIVFWYSLGFVLSSFIFYLGWVGL